MNVFRWLDRHLDIIIVALVVGALFCIIRAWGLPA